MRLKKAGALAAALAMALVFAGCSGQTADGAPGGDADAGTMSRTLTYGDSRAPGSLDPTKDLTHPMHVLAYEGLMKLTPEGEIEAGLATEWGFTDPEMKVFQLTLREDAKFSDGTPVNAEAVKAWFDRVAAAGGSYVGLVGGIVGVTADDEFTVTITLQAPNPDLALILSAGASNWGSIASPTALAENPDALASETFGAGPYKLDSTRTTSGDTYTYVRNENYYAADSTQWDEIIVRIITNPASRLQAMQSGQLDAAGGHYSIVEAAKADGEIAAYGAKLASQAFIISDAMGEKVPALGDVRVRQAMSYAIDRESIAQAIYGSADDALHQLPSYDALDPTANDYPYDVAKAKDLLADAGYSDGFSFRMVTEDFAGPDYVSVSQAVIQAWEEIGITMEIMPSGSVADYFTNFQSGAEVLHGAPQYDRTALMNYRLTMLPGGFFHPGSWQDDKLNAIYQEALVTDDRADLLRQLVDGISDEAYVIPVVAPGADFLASTSIENVGFTQQRMTPYLAYFTSGN